MTQRPSASLALAASAALAVALLVTPTGDSGGAAPGDGESVPVDPGGPIAQSPFPGAPLAPPTDPRSEGGEDEDDDRREERRRWLDGMHRSAPDVDWRAIERANSRQELNRRNLSASLGAAALRSVEPWYWEEIGSKNQAGHTRCAALGATRPSGRYLYVGSAGGGLWRGREDGSEWTPLSDGVKGGVDDVVVIEPADLTQSDILVMRQGASFYRSADSGATWTTPNGLGALRSARRMVEARDGLQTIYVFGSAIVGGVERSALFASIDEGRSFAMRASFGSNWSGDVWVPRTAALGGSAVYVLQAGQIFVSTDDGFNFGPGLPIDTGANAGDLVGSEDGGPTLYAALRQPSGSWDLHRSDDAGASSSFVRTMNAFWGSTQTMVAFANDRQRLIYGGLEAWVSTDGGATSTRINTWGSYYADPANRLHADIRGIAGLVDKDAPGEPDRTYFNTDGGTYISTDGGATVQNLSLDGLGVGQFYSTHTSSLDPRRISGGTQDQGYQTGMVEPSLEPGPSTSFVQEISGDYGHLVSGDGTHRYVYSTYPGFILVQDGETHPALRFVDFPTGSSQLWLPPVVADPTDRTRFFFLADRLYRYTQTSATAWSPTQWSSEDFSAGSSSYLTAMAFAPSDPNRAYAITNNGTLHRSNDGGVTWTQSGSSGPGSHYFYGAAILVDPADPDHAYVSGAGYSTAGVRETTDGGQSWVARASGLPSTLVFDIAWSPDGSGDLFGAAEAGAFHYDAQTEAWSNAMGNEAPATTYWTVETVPGSNRVRFGTYGRGIWDLIVLSPSADVGATYCSPAATNSTGAPAHIRALGSPFAVDNDVTLIADSLPINTVGYFLVSPNAGYLANPGGSSGNLCVGAPTGRYLMSVLNSGLLGTFALAVDLTAIPQPTSLAVAEPGETWRFQAWYRDAFLMVPTSNFTDGVALRIR